MTLSELLSKVGVSYAIPECLLYLEVRLSEEVCMLPLKCYLREVGKEALKKIEANFDEYSYSHDNLYLWISRSGAKFNIELASEDD